MTINKAGINRMVCKGDVAKGCAWDFLDRSTIGHEGSSPTTTATAAIGPLAIKASESDSVKPTSEPVPRWNRNA